MEESEGKDVNVKFLQMAVTNLWIDFIVGNNIILRMIS